MNKNYVTLKDVCEKASSSIAQKDLLGHDGIFPIYGASGFIKNVDFYKQEKEYIAIVKDGAGIGRAMKLPAHSSVIGTMQYIIPKENVNISYLYYAICAMHLEKYFSGATIPHIYFKDYQKEKLYLPSLGEQEKIASIFEKLEWLIANKKKQLDNLGLLVQSRFIEMFGEPIANPKKFPVKTIGEITTCILSGQSLSGTAGILQPGQKAVLKVSAVTNGYFKADEYKIINHPEQITKGIYPQAGDLLFSRANTREYVGATALVEKDYPALMLPDKLWKLAFEEEILPLFVKYYLSCQRIRAIMSASSSGTSGSMFNISMDKLREIKIFVPNIELQKEFQQFTQQVDKSKYRGEKSWHLLYVFYKKAMDMI